MDSADFSIVDGGVTAAKGYKASGIMCGIKQSGKKDIALIYSESLASAAAVFTTNKMSAAPVLVSKNHVSHGVARAIIVNSGNANACTADKGLKNAMIMAKQTADLLGLSSEQVLVASTGIIGVQLPMDVISTGIDEAAVNLKSDGGHDAAEAIMTTDTFMKEFAISFEIEGQAVTIGGMAKGSGMIEPNMATMLAFITTDVTIAPSRLQHILLSAINVSFNSITVDGDCSTNDMVAVLANGSSGVSIGDEHEELFNDALTVVCIELAKLIVRDGEGATKLIEIKVVGANNYKDAKVAAKAIANSNLVKTAFFGQDANWGRIVCAVGYSDAYVDPSKIDVYYGDIQLVSNGVPIEYDEPKVEALLKEKDVSVLVNLNIGSGEAVVWTCDFSYDYVKINAEYHT